MNTNNSVIETFPTGYLWLWLVVLWLLNALTHRQRVENGKGFRRFRIDTHVSSRLCAQTISYAVAELPQGNLYAAFYM